jgi:hypothetical protein
MARKKARKKYTFYCYVQTHVDKQACTMKSIREADLQEALFAYISREISLAADVSHIIEGLQKQDSYKRNQKTLENQINGLQNKLAQNRRFRGSLREDLKDGVISDLDYSAMKADYDAEREKLQRELDVLVLESSRQETTISMENKWIKEFRRFEMEQLLSVEMLAALVDKIFIYADKRIEVSLRYRDEYEALREYLENNIQGSLESEARAV